MHASYTFDGQSKGSACCPPPPPQTHTHTRTCAPDPSPPSGFLPRPPTPPSTQSPKRVLLPTRVYTFCLWARLGPSMPAGASVETSLILMSTSDSVFVTGTPSSSSVSGGGYSPNVATLTAAWQRICLREVQVGPGVGGGGGGCQAGGGERCQAVLGAGTHTVVCWVGRPAAAALFCCWLWLWPRCMHAASHG